MKVPRLRQHVVLDPLGAAPPRWELDPHFDLAYHERRLRAPGAGSLRDLLDLAAPIAMQAFDKDRPLWELYRVEGLEGGQQRAAAQTTSLSVGRRRHGAHDLEPGRAHARRPAGARGAGALRAGGARRELGLRRGAARAAASRGRERGARKPCARRAAARRGRGAARSPRRAAPRGRDCRLARPHAAAAVGAAEPAAARALARGPLRRARGAARGPQARGQGGRRHAERRLRRRGAGRACAAITSTTAWASKSCA